MTDTDGGRHSITGDSEKELANRVRDLVQLSLSFGCYLSKGNKQTYMRPLVDNLLEEGLGQSRSSSHCSPQLVS